MPIRILIGAIFALSRAQHWPAVQTGLATFGVLPKQARRSLKLGGYLALEHGYAQQQRVVGIVEGAGFEVRELGRDLAGLPRYVVAQSHS